MIIYIINLLKNLDLTNNDVIFYLLILDCILFSLFSAFATVVYIWYLEMDLMNYKQYFVFLSIILGHIFVCYNYALKKYNKYLHILTFNEYRKSKLI